MAEFNSAQLERNGFASSRNENSERVRSGVARKESGRVGGTSRNSVPRGEVRKQLQGELEREAATGERRIWSP